MEKTFYFFHKIIFSNPFYNDPGPEAKKKLIEVVMDSVCAEHKGSIAAKTAFCAIKCAFLLLFCPGNSLRHISMLSDLLFCF